MMMQEVDKFPDDDIPLFAFPQLGNKVVKWEALLIMVFNLSLEHDRINGDQPQIGKQSCFVSNLALVAAAVEIASHRPQIVQDLLALGTTGWPDARPAVAVSQGGTMVWTIRMGGGWGRGGSRGGRRATRPDVGVASTDV